MYSYEPYATVFAFGCVFGSVLPDIDRPGSIGSRVWPSLSRVINRRFGHRGFTHTPFAVGLLLLMPLLPILPVAPIMMASIYGIAAGCAVHLLQDLFTRQGIPLFYPFTLKKKSFCRAKSGSFWNIPITAGLVLLLLCLLSAEWRKMILSCGQSLYFLLFR